MATISKKPDIFSMAFTFPVFDLKNCNENEHINTTILNGHKTFKWMTRRPLDGSREAEWSLLGGHNSSTFLFQNYSNIIFQFGQLK